MPVVVAGALPPNTNLFSSPPPNPRVNNPRSCDPPPLPPIPRRPKPNPALKTTHSRTKYHKPVTQDVIPTSGRRAVVVGDSAVSYLLPGAPFPFQFSYSEMPKVRPLAFREPAFLPFSPPTMPRPWTGKAPLKSKREKELKRQKRIRLVQGLNGGEENLDGNNGTVLEMERDADVMARCRVDGRSREEVLGRPLSSTEVRALVKPCLPRNRQVNLGRDGLTHNMLELIHSHWRGNKICKVRCRGVPTLDMDNVCHHLEDKTGGKIIYRVGGVVFLFRGRHYDPRTRPRYPVMLWKPATPVYPKLIQEAPEGLTKIEADEMRSKGKKVLPICKLAKNGIYINLVKDVKDAFEESPLAKIDCQGLEPSDYKKIGAKLKDLVPCILLSFDEGQILIWRGKDWKSRYQLSNIKSSSTKAIKNDILSNSGAPDQSNSLTDGRAVRRREICCGRMLPLWNKAIEAKKALLIDGSVLTPDALLEKVEEFEGVSQAAGRSCSALVLSNDDENTSRSDCVNETKPEVNEAADVYDDSNYRDGGGGGWFDELESDSHVPYGMMPVDVIARSEGGRSWTR